MGKAFLKMFQNVKSQTCTSQIVSLSRKMCLRNIPDLKKPEIKGNL